MAPPTVDSGNERRGKKEVKRCRRRLKAKLSSLTDTQNTKRGTTEKAPLASLPFPPTPTTQKTPDSGEERREGEAVGEGEVGNTKYAMLAKYSPSARAMVAALGSLASLSQVAYR